MSVIRSGPLGAAAPLRERLARLAFPAAVLALAGCAGPSDARVLKLGHSLNTSHPVHLGMVDMAERVRAKSGGRLRIEIYPNQQLGTEREGLELLQIGSLDLTKVSAALLEAFVPSFRVFGLPFLFRDEAHLHRVLESEVGERLLLEGEAVRIRGLTFYDAGGRSFYTTSRPVHSPDDLRGLKIRTQESATAIQLVRALGAAPTPIAWGELYTALQQGVVDGAENNPPSFHLSRHYEVARYFTLNEHTFVPDVLVVSTTTWRRLSEEERRWLEASARESAVHQRALWRKANEAALEAVQEAGVTVIHPDKAPFMERVRAIYETFRHDPLYDLIRAIQAVG